MSVTTSYLWRIFDKSELESIIKDAKKRLNNIEFDAFAFCGMSGALIGPILAREMNKQFILIRKEKDNCHSKLAYEGCSDAKRVMIVDDLIETGTTLIRIVEIVENHIGAEVVGCYLYSNNYHVNPNSPRLIEKGLHTIKFFCYDHWNAK